MRGMEVEQTILPNEYEWYCEQIAGHHPSVIKNGRRELGFIKQCGSDVLLKPLQEGIRGQTEVAVYERVNRKCDEVDTVNREILAEFRSFIPQYYGLKTIEVKAAGEVREVKCIVMEDLAHTYISPCIMDIKMGKVTYDPNATEAKKHSEAIKYPEQEKLGFRLLGYRMHCPSGTKKPKIRDKLWGRSRTLQNIVNAFSEFFSGRKDEEIELASDMLSQLYSIRNWFQKQTIYHLYASSVLLIYEASPKYSRRFRVKLIDFSHVFPANNSIDNNYLFGLNNVIFFTEQSRNYFLHANSN